MTGIEYEKSIVALVCWQRLNSELYRGMIAVASVLHNRASAGWFQGSLYWNAVAMLQENKSDQHPDVRDPEFQKLMTGIDALYAGKLSDKTDGALYFANPVEAEVIAGQVTAKIGQTIFFK